MKKYLLLIFCMSILTINLLAQDKKQDEQTIEFNTMFVLKMSTKDSKNFEYNVYSKQSYKKIIKIEDVGSVIPEEIKGDEIVGIFAKGKMGDSESIFLILKSGIKKGLKFELEIKRKNNKFFEKTSVSNLYTNVPSMEIWPYAIDEIYFLNFRIVKE